MPTATATRRKKSEPVILDPIAVRDFVDDTKSEAPRNELFDPFNPDVPFFTAIAMLPDEEWSRYILYLYRSEPRVRNPEGEKAYIDKYGRCIDEEDIQLEHGGGRYLLILTEVPEKLKGTGRQPRERRTNFRIAGPAKLQSDQTLVNSPQSTPVVLPSENQSSSHGGGSSDVIALASVLKELIADRGHNDGGSNGQVSELMGQAYKQSISIVSESAKLAATSSTGSALGDKLLERLLDSKFGGKSGDSDLRDKLATIALERLANPQADQKDPLAQLGFVKDLLGVESVSDLLRPNAGGDAWKTRLVEVGAAFVGALPQLVTAFMANQDRQFQRAVQLEQIRRQQQPAIVPSGPASSPAAPHIAVQPIPTGEEKTPMTPIFNPAQLALEEIVTDFTEGLDGELTARLVRSRYPLIVEQLKPMMSDVEQVRLFCQNTAPLNEIAGEAEFPEFLEQFMNEVLHPAEEGNEPEDEGSPESSVS